MQRLALHVQESAKVESARVRKVLVVDDDDGFRAVVAEVLRSSGYRVACAANGEQALAQLHACDRPDVMLLDLMMPVKSGWEVLEELQDEHDLAEIPVIVVSALAAPGARGHLPKPIDADQLIATVGRLSAKVRSPPQ